MKVVILAGGLGTRISEETQVRPKPMVEIGGRPVLWHIMKLYSYYGFNDFIICLGYRGYMIKEFFSNYFLHTSDITFDLANNKMEIHQAKAEKWRVTLVDTGEDTQTGGRLKRIAPFLDGDTFCMTYGDGLSDVNIADIVEFHQQQGTLATLTSVQPPGRFGALNLDGNRILQFVEKPQGDGGWVSGGFFVLSSKVIDLINGDQTSWESGPLTALAQQGQLSAFRHNGFWRPLDTLRDKNYLEELWLTGRAPWKKWS